MLIYKEDDFDWFIFNDGNPRWGVAPHTVFFVNLFVMIQCCSFKVLHCVWYQTRINESFEDVRVAALHLNHRANSKTLILLHNATLLNYPLKLNEVLVNEKS